MNRSDGVLAKGFIVFILLLLLGFAVTVYTQKATSPAVKAAPMISAPVEPTPTPNDVHSSRADKKLFLRAITGKDGLTTYTFLIADISGANPRILLTKTLPIGSSMSIPFNAWDPTDTYVFIKERVAGVPNYYVLKANGEQFASGNTFIDVGAVWTEKKIGYSIREATGWASGTLLIIYTTKDDGSKGPAFWFEIPSTAIIQLAG